MADKGSEADLSLYHMARSLFRSVALLAVQQDLCPCQRNPEDINVPLRDVNAEVAKAELVDTVDSHTSRDAGNTGSLA